MPNIKKILKRYHEPNHELLLANAIKRNRIFVLTHGEYILKMAEYKRWRKILAQSKKGYSVAAITKNKEFFGLNFYVNKNVLIPRPETELMASEAIKEINKQDILVDIGTGSGCVAIAIAKNIPNKIKIFALDISQRALRVAKKNSALHQTKIVLIHSDLLKKLSKRRLSTAKKIIITANLPYLTTKQLKEETIKKEPRLALVAKEKGLQLYRLLLEQIKNMGLTKPLIIFFEINPGQIKSIAKLIKINFPGAKIEIKKDLAGQDRLVKITAN